MLLHGQCRNPVLTGSSVHNQRVERLWRDTYRCVLSLYYQVFYYLEDTTYLNPTSEIDLFCLHFVYEERINKSLRSFVDGWNCHGLSTESNQTPVQLFVSSHTSTTESVQDRPPSTLDLSVDELFSESVEVPSTACPLSQSQQEELKTLTHRESESFDYGIETYKHVREFVHSCL